MPKVSLDTDAKPFEIKVGLGFQYFGGMYQLGDPSMVPASRFRRLVNVRLGGKDVINRPGLTTEWSGAPDPVLGMAEILKRDSGRLTFGPFGGFWPDTQPVDLAPLSNYGFHAVLLDAPFSKYASGGHPNPTAEGDTVLHFIEIRDNRDETLETDQEIVDGQLRAPTLAPVGHNIAYFTSPSSGDPPPGTPLFIRGRPGAQDLKSKNATVYSMDYLGEVAASTVVPPASYVAMFPDESQYGPCLDPPLYFQGRWIAVGSINTLDNPGVLAGKASGSPGTGQQVFELNFNTETPAKPAPGAQFLFDAGTFSWKEAELRNFYGGSITELFRMPGVAVHPIPSRASGGLDGLTIRSMCVRTIRQDNPLTAAQLTKEKLYLGTYGGNPLTPAAWKVADVQLIHAYANPTDGKVYSWDGSTLIAETTGLGPYVVVTTLPDGSVLACGRTAAKLLDSKDETWKVVTYNPLPKTLPKVRTGAGLADAANPNPDWHSTGYIWTDRVVYRGEAYYIGFDSARLASNAGDFAPQFPLLPVAEPGVYAASCDALVIMRFNRATMQMVDARRGNDIYTAMRAVYWPGGDVSPFKNEIPVTGRVGTTFAPLLAVWSDTLFYAWSFDSGVFNGAAPANPFAQIYAIGAFDGSTWDDDHVYLTHFLPTAAYPNARHPRAMSATSRGLYIHALNFGVTEFDLWDGGTLITLIHNWTESSAAASCVFRPGVWGRFFPGIK